MSCFWQAKAAEWLLAAHVTDFRVKIFFLLWRNGADQAIEIIKFNLKN
jgi:hypothetical protein